MNLGRTTGLLGLRTLPDLPFGNSKVLYCGGGALGSRVAYKGEFSNKPISISLGV